MTLKRRLIQFLDHPGGRAILSRLGTAYARSRTGLDAQVFYDDAWIRRVGQWYLAESSHFHWEAEAMAKWQEDLHELLDIHRDWWFYRYQPAEGDVIIDVGAGIGDDALVFSRAVGSRGRVLSIEAHPRTFRLLEKTCRYNHLENTQPIHGALMDKSGPVFIEDRDSYQGNTVRSDNEGDELRHRVAGVTLDELCDQHHIGRIDFLKMNIEGAERLAIEGMEKMIPNIRRVSIACHDFLAGGGEFYRTKALVANFLRARGFEVCSRDDHPEPWVRDQVHGVRPGAK